MQLIGEETEAALNELAADISAYQLAVWKNAAADALAEDHLAIAASTQLQNDAAAVTLYTSTIAAAQVDLIKKEAAAAKTNLTAQDAADEAAVEKVTAAEKEQTIAYVAAGLAAFSSIVSASATDMNADNDAAAAAIGKIAHDAAKFAHGVDDATVNETKALDQAAQDQAHKIAEAHQTYAITIADQQRLDANASATQQATAIAAMADADFAWAQPAVIAPVFAQMAPPNPAPQGPSGFFDSLGSSLWSMGQTYKGIYQWLTGDPGYNTTLLNAYAAGPLGQTQNSSGIYWWGTRGALGVATAATAAATGVMAYGAIPGSSTVTVQYTGWTGHPGTYFHPMFRVGAEETAKWGHGLGKFMHNRFMWSPIGNWTPNPSFWNSIIFPIRNPAVVEKAMEAAYTSRTIFTNCTTCAINIISRGL